MRSYPTIAVAGIWAISLSLAACQNKPEIALPADMLDKAATCYAARITEITGDSDTLTAEQANETAQLVYLGAVDDGIAEPTKLPQIMAKAESLRPQIFPGNRSRIVQAIASR